MQTHATHCNNLFCTNLTESFIAYCTAYSIYGTALSEEKDDDEGKTYLLNCNKDEEPDSLLQLVPLIVLSKKTSYAETQGESPSSINVLYHGDIWMRNAFRLYLSLRQIMSLLESNASAYTYKDIVVNTNVSNHDQIENQSWTMPEEEVVAFESSIASFLTSATSQIDTMRRSIQEDSSSRLSEDVIAHRSGIISHLVCELEKIMKEFQYMQKVRHRTELELYLDPFKCILDQNKGDDGSDPFSVEKLKIDDLLDHESDDYDLDPDEEFLDLMEREEEEFQLGFQSQNDDDDDDDDDDKLRAIVEEPLPTFPRIVIQSETEDRKEDREWKHKKESWNDAQENGAPRIVQNDIMEQKHTRHLDVTVDSSAPQDESNRQEAAVLYQEQVFLNSNVQNTELDAAQTVEAQMMQITSLLSQFSSLISEQQEEIQIIAESAVRSRMNVKKGTEQIVQATEQKKRSRHYFAWIIFSLGVLLLFLNAVVA